MGLYRYLYRRDDINDTGIYVCDIDPAQHEFTVGEVQALRAMMQWVGKQQRGQLLQIDERFWARVLSITPLVPRPQMLVLSNYCSSLAPTAHP